MSLALSDPIELEVKPHQAGLPRHNSCSRHEPFPRHESIKVSDPLNFFRGLLMGTESGSYPNAEKVFLDAFEGYLKGKVNDTVAYEYMRIAKAYLKSLR
jgi:hypothetical protein